MTTGYVYDEIFLEHFLPGHPESPERLRAILEQLQAADLLGRLTLVPARPATVDELSTCHILRHIEAVEAISRSGGGHLDADTYTTSASFAAAAKAAGGLIDLTLAVLDGRLNNGFALIRPPGHHATPERAMGFCLFNNVALAARAAQSTDSVERVAIIDFDVHHGNGTQDIFEADPGVLFVSSHQYPHYPMTGSAGDIGRGEAQGTKINLPLGPGVGDDGFRRLYSDLVFPLVRCFQPQLILVSAGFDAHWDDPLAQLGLSLTGYGWLAQALVELAAELCGGGLVFTLEGGYNLRVLAPGVANVFRALLDQTEVDDPLGGSPWPEPDVTALLEALQELHHLS
ncbi:MAG: histone deacetylase [Anaerolineae bacterium]